MLLKRLPALVVLVFMATAAYAEATGSTYTDPAFHFSLEVPALGDQQGDAPVSRLIVSGPPVDGFATNCNVQVQYPKLNHSQFLELSLQQFRAAGIRVVEQKALELEPLEATRLEYAGRMGGRDLHFLAIVVSEADRVVMLTCTTLAKRIESERQVLLGVLESFKVQPAGERKGA